MVTIPECCAGKQEQLVDVKHVPLRGRVRGGKPYTAAGRPHRRREAPQLHDPALRAHHRCLDGRFPPEPLQAACRARQLRHLGVHRPRFRLVHDHLVAVLDGRRATRLPRKKELPRQFTAILDHPITARPGIGSAPGWKSQTPEDAEEEAPAALHQPPNTTNSRRAAACLVEAAFDLRSFAHGVALLHT